MRDLHRKGFYSRVSGIWHKVRRSPLNFVREELSPVDKHEHCGGLEHRVWEVTGDELLVLKEMMKKNMSMLKEKSEKNYPTLGDDISLDGERDTYNSGVLRDIIMDHADENDLTLEEALEELKEEDEKFRRGYEKEKGAIQKRAKELERVFEPFLSSRDV